MAGDLDFAKVSALLHFDGADGATTFIDSSGSPKTVTGLGTAAISTAQSVFGGSSLLSTGGGVTIPDDAGFDVATGDFSIEIRLRPTSFASAGIIVNKALGTGSDYPFQAYATTGGEIVFRSYSGATELFSITTSSVLSVNTWASVQLNRSGSTFRVLVDGVQVGSASYAGSLPSNSYAVSICAYSDNAYPFLGYSEEFRFTKGLARNVTTYTPSAAPFPGGGPAYTLSGTVRDATGALASRKVAAYREETNALVGTTTSDATTGVYSIEVPTDSAHTLIFYPAVGEDLNALVLRGVLPIES